MKRLLAKNKFNDILEIYNQLSKEDQLNISPSNNFIDSSYLISRQIKYQNIKPIDFSEAYKYNGTSTNVAFIIVAVLEPYRNLGIATQLIRNICNDCFNKGYKKIIYKCDINNISSRNLAKQCGFKLINQNKFNLTFELTLSQVSIRNQLKYSMQKNYMPAMNQRSYSSYVNTNYRLIDNFPFIVPSFRVFFCKYVEHQQNF